MRIRAVIPSLGERTEQLCFELVKRQVNEVIIVEGYERALAIRRAWELGCEVDILVLLPSDLLVAPNCVSQLISQLGSHDRVIGQCRSKFRGMGTGGVGVYNSKCLPRLLSLSKGNYTNAIRPESEPVMKYLNHSVVQTFSGLHEYELDYKELYVRYIFQMLKHSRKVKSLIPEFKRMAKTDDDYIAILQAIEQKGFSMGKKAPITDFEAVIKKYGL